MNTKTIVLKTVNEDRSKNKPISTTNLPVKEEKKGNKKKFPACIIDIRSDGAPLMRKL